MEQFRDIREFNNVIQSRVWLVQVMDTNTFEIQHGVYTSKIHSDINEVWDFFNKKDKVVLHEHPCDVEYVEAILN